MASSGFLPHGFFVVVVRPTAYDDDGVPIADADPTRIGRCARDQTQTIETIDGQQVVATSERLVCDDVDADVQPTDVLVFPDHTRWQVSGDVERLRNPFTGWSPGCVIPIARASGSAQPQPIEE